MMSTEYPTGIAVVKFAGTVMVVADEESTVITLELSAAASV